MRTSLLFLFGLDTLILTKVGFFLGQSFFSWDCKPRLVLNSYATLDRMGKQCCSFITDGEELKNNQFSPSLAAV